MKATGIFATDEERDRLHQMAQSARGPVLFVTGGRRIGLSMKDVHEAVYKAALAHGLPEIEGYYGMSVEGEFVTS